MSNTDGTAGISGSSGTDQVCYVNAKGGVGKMTVVKPYRHAQRPWQEMLLVDLDPQGVATDALGINVEH